VIVDYENLTATDGELVGCVAITNDNRFLYVNYSSSPSVQMTMANWTWLAVSGDKFLDFTPNVNGVPLSEKFLNNYTFNNGEKFHNFAPVDISDVLGSDKPDIFISAYATVKKNGIQTCTWISSDKKETYVAYNNPRLGPDVKGTPSPRSGTAVDAYVDSYHNPSLYLATTHKLYTFTIGKWIWESNPVKNPWKGDIVDFTKTFALNGKPVSGTLWITADDGYDISLNGGAVGKKGLNSGWQTSNLMYAYVPGHGLWKSVEQYDLMTTAHPLQPGTNTFYIQTANRYMGCDNYLPRGVTATDSDYPTDSGTASLVAPTGSDLVACGGSCAEPKGTTSTNIGALIYEAKICTDASSTKDAWVLSTDRSLDVNGAPAKFFDYILEYVTVSLNPISGSNIVQLPQTDQVITVTVMANSVPVPDAPLVISTTFDSGRKQVTTARTDNNGQATITVSSSIPDTATVTAWVDTNGNKQLDDGEFTYSTTVDWLVPTRLDLDPQTATVQLPDEAQVLTATVYDQHIQPMQNVQVNFTTTLGSITGTLPVITDENGKAVVTVSSSADGSATVTAFVDTNGNGVLDSGELKNTSTLTWLPDPPVLTKLTLSPDAASLQLPDATDQIITATALDQSNKPMIGIPVTFTTNYLVSGAARVTTVNTDDKGQASITITLSTPDTATITAGTGGLSAISTVKWLAVQGLAPEPVPSSTPEPTTGQN
jgi:hypothetical protein